MPADLHNNIHPVLLFPPLAALTNVNTPRVSAIIDRMVAGGFEAVEFVLINGTNTDTNATFAVVVEDGEDPALTDAAPVPAAQLLGTPVLAGFTAATDDVKCRKIGYVGIKRYVRVTVTPTGNDAGDWFMAGVAILGHPRHAPTPNPPQ